MTLTTKAAVQAVAWGRAPRQTHNDGSLSRVNRRIVCADGFKVSVQASDIHYCDDSSGEDGTYYWRSDRDQGPVYPFTKFEIGNPSDDLPDCKPWNEDGGGVWAWVEPKDVKKLLKLHGGAVGWETA